MREAAGGSIKGWCPGAYRPMSSGDGLIMRVRPRAGRLSHVQGVGLCEIALRFGNGVIDLTNRANLQLRGVKAEDHEAVLEALLTLDLLDETPEMETRRNIICAPLQSPQGQSTRLAKELAPRLHELPPLPAKFGFAMDAEGTAQLRTAPADIRIETGTEGLILRADGSPLARLVQEDQAIDALIALAHWFAKTRAPDVRRMAKHLLTTPLPAGFEPLALPSAAAPLLPAQYPQGRVFGAAFGSLPAPDLRALMQRHPDTELILTPFRMFMLSGEIDAPTGPFITAPHDPRLSVDACPGAPACPAAHFETRALASRLAPHLRGKSLHVSGCAKGCARPRKADVVLVGQNDGFHLVLNGCSWDVAVQREIQPDSVLATVINELGRS